MFPAALAVAGAWLRKTQNLEPIAVGHRVVHSEPQCDRPILIDARVLYRSGTLCSAGAAALAEQLAPRRSILARSPDLPQVVCFDTALPSRSCRAADPYAIPKRFYEESVRRYRFHGCRNMFANRLPQAAPVTAGGKVIICHPHRRGAHDCTPYIGAAASSPSAANIPGGERIESNKDEGRTNDVVANSEREIAALDQRHLDPEERRTATMRSETKPRCSFGTCAETCWRAFRASAASRPSADSCGRSVHPETLMSRQLPSRKINKGVTARLTSPTRQLRYVASSLVYTAIGILPCCFHDCGR
jgi:hypothetical protein